MFSFIEFDRKKGGDDSEAPAADVVDVAKKTLATKDQPTLKK